MCFIYYVLFWVVSCVNYCVSFWVPSCFIFSVSFWVPLFYLLRFILSLLVLYAFHFKVPYVLTSAFHFEFPRVLSIAFHLSFIVLTTAFHFKFPRVLISVSFWLPHVLSWSFHFEFPRGQLASLADFFSPHEPLHGEPVPPTFTLAHPPVNSIVLWTKYLNFVIIPLFTVNSYKNRQNISHCSVSGRFETSWGRFNYLDTYDSYGSIYSHSLFYQWQSNIISQFKL